MLFLTLLSIYYLAFLRALGQAGMMRWLLAVSAGIGAAIGATLSIGLVKTVPGTEAGDWLSFAGALVGVVVSIAGAVWIENRKRTLADKADALRIRDALVFLENALDRVLNRPANAERNPRAGDPEGEAIEIVFAYDGLLRAFETFRFVREQLPHVKLRTWRQLRMIEEQTRLLRTGFDSYDSVSERLDRHIDHLKEDYAQMKSFASATLPLVRGVRRELDA